MLALPIRGAGECPDQPRTSGICSDWSFTNEHQYLTLLIRSPPSHPTLHTHARNLVPHRHCTHTCQCQRRPGRQTEGRRALTFTSVCGVGGCSKS